MASLRRLIRPGAAACPGTPRLGPRRGRPMTRTEAAASGGSPARPSSPPPAAARSPNAVFKPWSRSDSEKTAGVPSTGWSPKGLAAARRRLPASPAEVLRPRTDATGRTRRPGRPGVTDLDPTELDPGRARLHPRLGGRGDGAGNAAQSDWGDAAGRADEEGRPTTKHFRETHRALRGDEVSTFGRPTKHFGVRDQALWGPGPMHFGSGDQALWGPGPSTLGSGTKHFGVRNQALWGADFGVYIDITRLNL